MGRFAIVRTLKENCVHKFKPNIHASFYMFYINFFGCSFLELLVAAKIGRTTKAYVPRDTAFPIQIELNTACTFLPLE